MRKKQKKNTHKTKQIDIHFDTQCIQLNSNMVLKTFYANIKIPFLYSWNIYNQKCCFKVTKIFLNGVSKLLRFL